MKFHHVGPITALFTAASWLPLSAADTTGVEEQKQKHLRDRRLPSIGVNPSLNKFGLVPSSDDKKIRNRDFQAQIVNGQEVDPRRKYEVSVRRLFIRSAFPRRVYMRGARESPPCRSPPNFPPAFYLAVLRLHRRVRRVPRGTQRHPLGRPLRRPHWPRPPGHAHEECGWRQRVSAR